MYEASDYKAAYVNSTVTGLKNGSVIVEFQSIFQTERM